MKEYDVIVVGSGCGLTIVEEALGHGLHVALVDKGPLGGTCLNNGCIPSKMLIYPADVIMEIEEAGKLGISAGIKNVDFPIIMERMRKSIQESKESIRNSIKAIEELDFYETTGHFTGEYTMDVDGETIKAKQIFLASGSRPFIPPIKGVDKVDYLTNETLLEINKAPDSLIIVGGGYIGVEYGHFFAAMGTKVTIVEMAERLVMNEEPEISELLKKALGRRMAVYTDTQVEEIKSNGGNTTVVVKDKKNGKIRELVAQKILLAVGRRSNADLLKVENTGVEVDKKGYIKVNERLETTKQNIYAVGDANGVQMFTHVANREAALAINNVLHGNQEKMDYRATPHAVYSHPQIAGVGQTESEARKDHKIVVGRARYMDTAKGEAMMESEGFAKAIIEEETDKILGFHIIGPGAPEIIQEVTNAMASESHIQGIISGMHIHPSLSELIPRTLGSLEEG